jgi:hypothetical protein
MNIDCLNLFAYSIKIAASFVNNTSNVYHRRKETIYRMEIVLLLYVFDTKFSFHEVCVF